MGPEADQEQQAYSPWTIVDLVFGHLTEQGLRPTLGSAGDPGEPAAALLRTLGIAASAEGDPRVTRRVHQQLAQMRAQMDQVGDVAPRPWVSQSETSGPATRCCTEQDETSARDGRPDHGRRNGTDEE